MHRTLEKLYNDHIHFQGLLDLLEGELNRSSDNEFFDSQLLLELVDYFREYADTIHHPIEDQLYEQMLARSDEGKEPMKQLLGHHLIIANMSRELREALQGTQDGEAVAAARVDPLGREFIHQQRDHMRYEEESAFPLLAEQLVDEQFDLAAGAIPDIDDPLDNPLMAKRYPTLFETLSTIR